MPSHRTLTATTKVAVYPPRRPSQRLWVLLLLLFGFALRLFQLGSESLWYDETVSAYLASQPIPELIAHTERDIHPPAYYLLLHAWRLLATPTVAFGLEYLYAWPSLCLAMLVLALTFVVAKRCFGPTAALWALALALLQPVQIWFAQEVRMYALGAFCVMLTLWAVLPLLCNCLLCNREQISVLTALPRQTLILYPIAALLGLYTIYYFLFWLVVLNLCVLLRLWRQGRALRTWLLLQLLVLIGWLPWLPTFVHQATSPPVPAWRVPWQSALEIVGAISEGVAAIWVGHTPLLSIDYPWAIFILLVAALFVVYAKSIDRQSRFVWLLLCFGPLLLLLGISLIGPPIYHVRYVATYAPIFSLLLGALLANLRRTYALTSFLMMVLISGFSLGQLWTNPRYAADDHRNAVATLARQWRPGDAIMVNAGWAYTALSVYWPTELPSGNATRPPALAAMTRLTDLDAISDLSATTAPIIVRTGSINGPATLGWGLPESDFFPVSTAETTTALTQLAANHARIWHYRLYDTVSDPTGLIRTWLNEHTKLEFSQPFPGRDYLLLEGYRTPPPPMPPEAASTFVKFPDISLSLVTASYLPALPAGETLYLALTWQSTQEITATTTSALSLRLYDAQGQLLLQNDTPLMASALGASVQQLALPIPAGTIPDDYTLSLVVYAPDTLAPYTTTASDGTQLPSPIPLGQVAIQLPIIIPHSPMPLATFDYMDLLQVELPTTPLAPGASFTSAWTWRPRPSPYRDHYTAHLQLSGGEVQQIRLLAFDLGSESYPSSQWPAHFPLTQRVSTTLPAGLPPGMYQLHVSLTRIADGQSIPARLPWRPWQQPSFHVGEIEIVQAD